MSLSARFAQHRVHSLCLAGGPSPSTPSHRQQWCPKLIRATRTSAALMVGAGRQRGAWDQPHHQGLFPSRPYRYMPSHPPPRHRAHPCPPSARERAAERQELPHPHVWLPGQAAQREAVSFPPEQPSLINPPWTHMMTPGREAERIALYCS